MLQKQAESNRPDLRKPMHCIALRITSNKLQCSKQFKTKTKNSLRSPSCSFISDINIYYFEVANY